MDQETMNEFKALRTFLQEHMVTKQDLAELRSEVATKEELRALTNTIEGFVKMVKDYYQEVTITAARATRMEAWIQKASDKIGIEYKP
jgi:sulfur relay (sulfurtransferase) DsrC/TusE family protein